MLQETALVAKHRELGGKLVDFGGWNMPLHYGSQIEEHHAVRQSAGVFDVSHMTVVDVHGAGAKAYLQYLLANDVAKLTVQGKALYSAMLNADGGVIDDLIVYLMADGYRLVVNCATREKDLAWMNQQTQGFDVAIVEQPSLAMLAVQGPKARDIVSELLDASLLALPVFQGRVLHVDGADWFIARTGYTGEDGFELMLPEQCAEAFMSRLLAKGAVPCGLGARDTLRLEAGMNLYGHEMDDTISPWQANMAWTVALSPATRDFIGRAVLEKEQGVGITSKLVGLVIKGKGVLRAGQVVVAEGMDEEGVITSGTFSPTLATSIALARVPVAFPADVHAIIRGRSVAVTCVKPCFVRHGKTVVDS